MLWKPFNPIQFPLLGNDARFSSLFSLKTPIFQLLFALILGFCLNQIQIPVGWLLGAILAGSLSVLVQRNPQPFPPILFTSSQAIIAIATATRFSPQSLILAKHYALPLTLCICVTGGMSLLNGYFLHRLAGIDKKTGFLASIPGASASIVAMSEEMEADAMVVALLQSLRVVLVALLIPLLVSFLFPFDASDGLSSVLTYASSSYLPLSLDLMLVAGCCGLGVWLGKGLKLPSGLFLGPFMVGLTVFWLFPQYFYVPQPLFIIGLILLGLSIGLKVNFQTVQKLLKVVLIEFCLIIVLILSCLGAGYLFHLITHIDTMTAILGSTPGGISAMMATAINLQGDTGLVMTMQMTRMLLILLLSPLLANTLKKNEAYSVIDESIRIK